MAGLAEPGSQQWVTLAVWLAILSGITQIVLGWVRFGWLLNVVNAPVLMAFTQAAAVLIILSQWKSLLGWKLSGTAVQWEAMAFGVLSLALLWVSRRIKPTFPAVLVLVLLSAGISRYSGYADRGGHVVGQLPQGVSWLTMPGSVDWSTLQALFVPVLVITLVSFLETASSAKVDNARQGSRWNQNQDLIGQGLAKMASGLVGAFPTSSSFSRSALNLYAGAQTGWATVFSVVVVWLASMYMLPVLYHVPQAVLAAIVVIAVLGLIKPMHYLRLWKVTRVEAVIAGVTFAATLLSAPKMYWGVLTGVLMALAHFLYQRLHPRIIEVGLHADGRLRDRHLWSLPPIGVNTLALRMDAELDFGSANALEQKILEYVTTHPTVRRVALFAQPINRIDATGIEVFERIALQMTSQDRQLIMVGAKLPVERALKAAGVFERATDLLVFVRDEEALAYLRELETRAIQS